MREQRCRKKQQSNNTIKPYNFNTMKNTALTLIISFSLALLFLSGCNSPDQKMENAKSAVVEANHDLEQATQEYQADMNQYRKHSADRIAANDSAITVFKTQIANEPADVKAAHEKQLAILEQKNSDMKKKLADYKGEGKEQWETFKANYNREMNTLGEAFDKLTKRIS